MASSKAVSLKIQFTMKTFLFRRLRQINSPEDSRNSWCPIQLRFRGFAHPTRTQAPHPRWSLTRVLSRIQVLFQWGFRMRPQPIKDSNRKTFRVLLRVVQVLFGQGSRARPRPIKNTTRSTLKVLSRSRVLFRSDSTTWQNLIRHGPKDPSIRCLECH